MDMAKHRVSPIHYSLVNNTNYIYECFHSPIVKTGIIDYAINTDK